MQCPHCTTRIPKNRGLTVTCGKSECQEAEFEANKVRNKPKPRKLKPKEGALKADGTKWTNQPGGIQKLEIPVPSPTSNEHMFARLLVEVVGHVKFDYALMTSLGEGIGIDFKGVGEIIDRAEAVVFRVKNARS